MQFENEKECFDYLDSINKRYYEGTIGCNGTFDHVLCFEATPANKTLSMPCPQMAGVFDVSKTLLKTCLPNGVWEGFNKTGMHAGYTNYDPCLTEATLKQAHMQKNLKYYNLILTIVLYEEVIGICLSILFILFSLSIFISYKSLRCKRTKIHLNLFVAILGQSLFRLAFFFDRLLYDEENSKNLSYASRMMQVSVKLCPIGMAFLEYFQSCNFMWMLCEGIYLNLLLTYSIFDNSQRKFIIAFYFIGWVLPAITVTSWFITMYNVAGFDEVCWFGYYENKYYWIIQGPILLALITNIFCLVNVIRILTKKLRENSTNDSVNQIKKSFKAAALLLPLLGVTHLFEMYHGHPANWILNLIYSVVNCFLVFFNGVFLSILYCFMNNEVKNVIKRHWLNKLYDLKLGKNRSPKNNNRNTTENCHNDLEVDKTLLNSDSIQMNNMSNAKLEAKKSETYIDTETIII